MNLSNYISFNLHFSKEDIGILREHYLKRFFQHTFWNIYEIYLHDNNLGNFDGLVDFRVEYNHVYKFYRFSLCGGKFKEKTKEMIDIFKSLGYVVSAQHYTWANKFGKQFDGLQFSVRENEKPTRIH